MSHKAIVFRQARTVVVRVAGVLLVVAIACVATPVFAQIPPEEMSEKSSAESPAKQIMGDWVRYQDTAKGRLMTIKQHLGDRTILTIYDPNQKPLVSYRSQYKVDDSGSVPVFRYKNKVVVQGPNRGAKDATERAYIFRVDDGKFYEVHGMLPGDDKQPQLIIWERLKDNPVPKQAT
ncbi:hypothetical protein LOC72_17590 [Roseiconus lacunae]|nr:hypothetical protein [Roseiconus lacunae]